ncbi:MAG: 16S rRNA (uracil(1498)-N(3))-methyltransferase [Alphaproteobacteria bacterium]|nr:16S rRNA (uracil(1498)-N(3))-methyltransferase [Alphaproteobacteria bacterium]
MRRMAKTTPRLYLDAALAAGAELVLAREQGHYLTTVLRMVGGDPVQVFNSTDGEWLAYITDASKKQVAMRCEKKISEAKPPPDIDFLFAPIKHQRLDYVVEKATELGMRRLRPMITARTIVERVNMDRMRATAREAAEQCNQVYVPEVLEPEKFSAILQKWDASRSLIFCDETATVADPLKALEGLEQPLAICVGPEGGFSNEERNHLKSLSFVRAVHLGPRIMRADTAAMAIMAVVQAKLGDWGSHNNT